MEPLIKNTTVIMPLGGLGTRARKYTQGRYSKFLIPLKRNFTVLDLIIESLLKTGFRKYIFCIGTLFSGELVEKVLSHKTIFDNSGCDYRFFYEKELLGGVGAYNKAFSQFKFLNPAISVPGDMFLPWLSFPKLIEFHLKNKCAITIGLTDTITEYTTDIGKIWMESESKNIVKCLEREESENNLREDIISLTSAGVYVFNPKILTKAYRLFLEGHPEIKKTQIEMRDHLLPWFIQNKKYNVKGYNLQAKILDVGDCERILYAKQNWKAYI